jgi:hypothetical protein
MSDVRRGDDYVVASVQKRTSFRGKDDIAVETVRIVHWSSLLSSHCPELGGAAHIGCRHWKVSNSTEPRAGVESPDCPLLPEP